MGPARCAEPGCGRFVRASARWCDRHRGEGDPTGESDDRAAAFWARLAEGDYRQLYEEPLWQVIRQAAEVRGLGDELGALRVVLSRLLTEEPDVSKLAAGVVRVVTAAAKTVTVQQALEERREAGGAVDVRPALAVLDKEEGRCADSGGDGRTRSGSNCDRLRPTRR